MKELGGRVVGFIPAPGPRPEGEAGYWTKDVRYDSDEYREWNR